jgi:phenylalanyl-tRNA synthetase beta chain
MQFPESWLREFCNPPIETAELAELLTMAGLEVEDTRPVAPPCEGVVVAEIVEAVQHPNADKLRVCKVLAGPHSPDGPLQIVCGAPNARVGIRVPLGWWVPSYLRRKRADRPLPSRSASCAASTASACSVRRAN